MNWAKVTFTLCLNIATPFDIRFYSETHDHIYDNMKTTLQHVYVSEILITLNVLQDKLMTSNIIFFMFFYQVDIQSRVNILNMVIWADITATTNTALIWLSSMDFGISVLSRSILSHIHNFFFNGTYFGNRSTLGEGNKQNLKNI